MTRKIITLTLSALMLLSLVLTGCSGSSTTSTTAAATTAAASAAATTAAGAAVSNAGKWDTGSIEVEDLGIDGGGAEITWINNIGPNDARNAVWEEMESYVSTVYNIKVDMSLIAGDEYNSKMMTLISSGMAPDVMLTGTSNCLLDLVQDDVLLDLTPYFDEYMPRTYEKSKDYLAASTFDGKVLMIMPFKDLAENNSVLYDKRWLDESGLEMVEWTQYSDLDELLYNLREWSDEKYPERHDIATSQMFSNFNRMYLLEYYSSANNTIVTQYEGLEFIEGKTPGSEMFCMYDTPEFLAHVKRLNQLVTDRIYPYDVANYDKDGVYKKSGEQFCWYSQGYVFAPDSQTNYECYLQKQAVSMMYTGYVNACGSCVYIDTPNPEAACQFIEICHNDKYLGTCLRFGKEGVHWTMTENGQADCTLGKDTGIKYWYGVQIGDITNCALPTDVDPAFGEALKEVNGSAIHSSNLGFSVVTDDVSSEIAAVSAVCTEYLNNTSLYSGMLTEEETETKVAEFVQKLKDSGVEKILTEFQGQLDEWRAANGK